jgi:hypothetical protein
MNYPIIIVNTVGVMGLCIVAKYGWKYLIPTKQYLGKTPYDNPNDNFETMHRIDSETHVIGTSDNLTSSVFDSIDGTAFNIDGAPMLNGMGGTDINGHLFGETDHIFDSNFDNDFSGNDSGIDSDFDSFSSSSHF